MGYEEKAEEEKPKVMGNKIRSGNFSIPTTVESLFSLMRSKEDGLLLGSHYYRFRRFKDAFLGSEAVTWIMKQCKTNRSDAVVVAQELLRRGFIQNLIDQSTMFHDSKNSIYSYTQKTFRAEPQNITLTALNLIPSLNRLRARKFENVGFLGRTYADCFLGTDVIDLIMNEVRVDDRRDAVSIAQSLLGTENVVPVLTHQRRVEFDEFALYKLKKKRTTAQKAIKPKE
jgi:hypothetical protein